MRGAGEQMAQLARDLADACRARGAVPQGIWLFGSRARGEEHPESDYDLAILCEGRLGFDLLSIQDRLSRESGRELDLIELATAPPELAWQVVTTGRLLLEEDERAVEHFVRHARYAVEDAERKNRMIVLAQLDRGGPSP